MGVYSPVAGLTYYPGFTRESGNAAFVSQSGGLVERMIRIGMVRGIHFSQIVSYGNALDVDESDLLEYFSQDPETEIVAAYIEGIKDGRRFMKALGEATARKPVVIYKGGTTEAGQRATYGHTASLTSSGGTLTTYCSWSTTNLVRKPFSL